MERSEFPHLHDSQDESVQKGGIIGPDILHSLAAATSAEQHERANGFAIYEAGLVTGSHSTWR